MFMYFIFGINFIKRGVIFSNINGNGYVYFYIIKFI